MLKLLRAVQVVAVPVTRALCESVSSCPESRFGGEDDDDDYDYSYGGGFYDYRPRGSFISRPQPATALKPAEQALLLGAGQTVCSGLPAAGGSWSDCSWVLPDFGIFAIVACVPTGQGNQRECTVNYAGRRLAEWQDDPLEDAPQATWRWAVPTGADGFEVGSEATIEIESPVAGARALLVVLPPCPIPFC